MSDFKTVESDCRADRRELNLAASFWDNERYSGL